MAKNAKTAIIIFIIIIIIVIIIIIIYRILSRSTSMQNLEVLAQKLTDLWQNNQISSKVIFIYYLDKATICLRLRSRSKPK